jgi:hypothetical protein
MGKKYISAVISLKDNMSGTMREIRREQKQFQRELKKTKGDLRRAAKEKYTARLDATKAHKKLKDLRKDFKQKRTRIVNVVAKTQLAKEKLDKIKNTAKAVGRMSVKPIVALKDKASSMIGAIKSKLSAFRAPITIAVTALVTSVKSAMDLEKQQISVSHFMGVNNKDKSAAQISKMSANYTKLLRDNANATPFTTNEVMAAGTRALQISKGSTKEAMKTLKLAEDMAALNPGKTVSDAMEALADADMGEMERLKEFGYKGSSTDDPKKTREELSKLYSGGSAKLAQSGAGAFSTMVGNLQTGLAEMGTGILQSLVPAMSGVTSMLQGALPTFTAIGNAIGQGIGGAVSFLSSQMPVLQPIFQEVWQSVSSIIQTTAPIIGQAIKALWPVFMGVFRVASVALNGISQVVSVVAPYVKSAISAIAPSLKNVGSVLTTVGNTFKRVFTSIMNIVKKAYNFVKPLIDGIGNALSSVTGFISGGVSRFLGGNATGTKYWSGGLSVVGEHGPELVQMPSGSKVFTNRESRAMVNRAMPTPVRASGSQNNINITISKLAESFNIANNMDIRDIVEQFVEMLRIALLNYA